ncbi:hypothetical protein F4809DRAFT_590447 [Biscogniauxia mediterranea]|nr:hypothetical protein F4809DRAFT_590447 [Biscogniauxia mediterranea]
MSTTHDLGPLVRLWGIRTQDLPPQTATADELAPFLTAILGEAIPFIDSAAPKSNPNNPNNNNNNAAATNKLWKSKGSKSHPDSAARVEVSERVVPARDLEEAAAAAKDRKRNKILRPETWCCRRSVHADAARRGTASWAEFERCFRDEHAASESRFTPSVAGAREAVRWGGCEGVVVDLDLDVDVDVRHQQAGEGEGEDATKQKQKQKQKQRWTHFGLAVVEMRHKIGRPLLKDRTFPILQMTCSITTTTTTTAAAEEEEQQQQQHQQGEREFLVVSIPVPDFGAPAASPAAVLSREKGALVAPYVAVERVRGIPGTENIEWLMATASDAGGALPMWAQTLAAPGVIWKDVPLFLGWIAGEREKGKGKGKAEQDQGVDASVGTGA